VHASGSDLLRGNGVEESDRRQSVQIGANISRNIARFFILSAKGKKEWGRKEVLKGKKLKKEQG